NRRVSSDYSTFTYDNVVLFEFFMPLTNEAYLRTSLDSLFYKDSVLTRLETIEPTVLNGKIPVSENEGMNDYFERICELVSNTFGGYSISHVSGRYRADKLKTRTEVLEDSLTGQKQYLVDETTAVVKFIFPLGKYETSRFSTSNDYFDDISRGYEEDLPIAEANIIRWLFYTLFVQSIVQIVNGEDEIWMLESGMRNRLHIWRVTDSVQ